jgi:hypothetical protein
MSLKQSIKRHPRIKRVAQILRGDQILTLNYPVDFDTSMAIAATSQGALLICYLLFEAKAIHNVLGELRHELLKEVGIISIPTRKPVQSIQA